MRNISKYFLFGLLVCFWSCESPMDEELKEATTASARSTDLPCGCGCKPISNPDPTNNNPMKCTCEDCFLCKDDNGNTKPPGNGNQKPGDFEVIAPPPGKF